MTENLRSKPVLIIDCQTTGMRPSVGHLLEFAWAFASAGSDNFEINSSVVALPAGESIPARVKEITGIRNSDLTDATLIDDVRAKFMASIGAFQAETGRRPVALIHYAQFEEAWLKDLLGKEKLIEGALPFDLICTHRISRKLFPQVPSRNIRGLTGFFGMRIGEIKRAAQHVLATQMIWTGIVSTLKEREIETLDQLQAYLAQKPEKRKVAPAKSVYEYRVDRAKRLGLPAKPGIYKMIAKTGEVLYVGKATCLKDRVNSYFRGKKGRDPRKLELMAQVWDVEVIECGSAIEAALLESDEIKRLNPPYNVSLKEGGRALIYYDLEFSSESLHQSTEHPVGPFRRFNAIDHVRIFADGLRSNLIANVFYQPIDDAVLEGGYALFEAEYPGFDPECFSVRDHLAFGLKLLKTDNAISIEEAVATEDATSTEAESMAEHSDELTALDIFEKIERLYRQAARTYLRTKELTRLLWSDVAWTEKGEHKSLIVRGGQLRADQDHERKQFPWESLAIRDYDRMSVLLSEISKVDHEITAI